MTRKLRKNHYQPYQTVHSNSIIDLNTLKSTFILFTQLLIGELRLQNLLNYFTSNNPHLLKVLLLKSAILSPCQTMQQLLSSLASTSNDKVHWYYR